MVSMTTDPMIETARMNPLTPRWYRTGAMLSGRVTGRVVRVD